MNIYVDVVTDEMDQAHSKVVGFVALSGLTNRTRIAGLVTLTHR